MVRYKKLKKNRPKILHLLTLNNSGEELAIIPSELIEFNLTKHLVYFSGSSLRLAYAAPKSPKGCSKTQNGRFRGEIALRFKTVCYKVSWCGNCRRQVVTDSLA